MLDRQEMWSDSSGANAGTVAVQNKISGLQPMTRLAVSLWQQMQQQKGLDLGFKKLGGLRVALDQSQVNKLRKDWSDLQSMDLNLQWLGGEQLRAFAHWLGPEVSAAVYCPFDSQSIPLQAGPAFKKTIQAQGGRLISGASVSDILPGDGQVLVVTDSAGEICCRDLIITAGPWSRDLINHVGWDFPIGIDVNMLSVTDRVKPVLDRVITHVSGILSLKQYPNGTCIIGGGWQGRGDLITETRDIDYENLLHNFRLACAVVPALENCRLLRSWAGFEPVMPDALPCLGNIPGHKNLWIATGARGGYSLGPAQGKLISEMILGMTLSLDAVEPFDPARFNET